MLLAATTVAVPGLGQACLWYRRLIAELQEEMTFWVRQNYDLTHRVQALDSALQQRGQCIAELRSRPSKVASNCAQGAVIWFSERDLELDDPNAVFV